MLSREENEMVTRVGPGTPMGELMRRYWVPAALSRELPEPDCAPVRVKLLGERLVAFRDTSGRLGLVDEFCPHRRASLFLGRNEEDGLRCVYHGWKFDVAGNCLDMLNLPSDTTFKTKICLKSYPTIQNGGIVWAYMGPPEKRPALPLFEWTQLPKTHRFVQKAWEECNWLQAMEGASMPATRRFSTERSIPIPNSPAASEECERAVDSKPLKKSSRRNMESCPRDSAECRTAGFGFGSINTCYRFIRFFRQKFTTRNPRAASRISLLSTVTFLFQWMTRIR